MVSDELFPAVLRYVVLAAGATVAVLFAAATVLEFPFTLLAMLLGGFGFIGVFLVAGPTDAGVGTAEAGAEAGFLASDPNGLRPGTIPGRHVVGLYLVGLGIHAVVAIAAVDALG